MTEPHIRLKVNLYYDERNQDCDVDRVEDLVREFLNPADERVADVRIAVGRAAGAVFLHLEPETWNTDKFERLADMVPGLMERYGYADNITRESDVKAKVVS